MIAFRNVSTALACVGIFGAAGCAKHAPAAPPPPYVATAVAQTTTITPSSTISGIAAPFKNVAIQSSLIEPTDDVYVKQGDYVHKGEVLAQLDTQDLQAQLASDLASANNYAATTQYKSYTGNESIAEGNLSLTYAQQALHTAQANLFRDQQILARDRALLQNGYISVQQEQIDAATVRGDQTTLSQDQTNIQNAGVTVQANGSSLNAPGVQSANVAESQAETQMELANAQQIRVSIAKARIVSPINGYVVNRNLNPGEYPGSREIFTLQQTDPMYAYLRGSSTQIAGIADGATATITTTGADGKRIIKHGKVVGSLDEIVPGSTQFQLVVQLSNPDHVLRSGMAVQGNVALPVVHGIGVPYTAFTDQNRDTIQIVQPDATVKTVHVTDVATDGTTSIVSGIASGTRVVSNGESTNLGDGEKISYQP